MKLSINQTKANLFGGLLIYLLLLNSCIQTANTEEQNAGCEYDGQQYKTGDRFSIDQGCNQCSCTEDGEIICTERACATCEYEGETFNVGEGYSPDHECNQCTCNESGEFVCTRSICEVTCGSYAVGEVVSSDACQTCTCMETGDVECLLSPCAEPVCEYENITYTVGDSFPASDGCNTCSCEDAGVTICSQMPCVNGCEYAGMMYAIGDLFPAEDGCNDCSCNPTGQVACTEAVCTELECSTSSDCTEDFYCVFSRSDCGEGNQLGRCVPKPEGCLPIDEGHFCGCDGTYADGLCTLAQRGVDLQPLGACNLPTNDGFVCGEQTCALGMACSVSWNDVFGPNEPLFYAGCVEITCDAVDPCDCFVIDQNQPVTCEQRNEHTFVYYPGG